MFTRLAAVALVLALAAGGRAGDFDLPPLTPDPPPLVRRVESLEGQVAVLTAEVARLKAAKPVETFQLPASVPASFPLRPVYYQPQSFTYPASASDGGCSNGKCSVGSSAAGRFIERVRERRSGRDG